MLWGAQKHHLIETETVLLSTQLQFDMQKVSWSDPMDKGIFKKNCLQRTISIIILEYHNGMVWLKRKYLASI